MLPRTMGTSCLWDRRVLRNSFAALAVATIFIYTVFLPLYTKTNFIRYSYGKSDKAQLAVANPSFATTGTWRAGPQSQKDPSTTDSLTNNSTVPILHQSWKTSNLPPRFRRWSLSFSRCHPDWHRRLWTDADNENLIATHFTWFLPTYRKFTWPVQKADVSRLFYMYKYGGVYCDLDCECLQPFGHLLANVSLAFGAMEGHTIDPADGRYVKEGQIENSFMYSIPGHPLILRLIKQVEKEPLGNPEDTTGPYMLMREIHRLRRSKDGMPAAFRGKKYLEIFPPSFFNPFSWINNRVPACKDKGGFTRADEDKCRAAHSNQSFVLQYHTQVWQAGEKYLNKD